MSREVMKQAQTELLRILECINEGRIMFDGDEFHETLRALQAALAQPDHPEDSLDMVTQPDPLFAAPVAAKKWAALQDEGYKMQQLSFARDGVTGTIDDWGKVLWEPVQPAANALKSAREIGENGTPHSESERLLFDEYMRGHNWKCDSWNPDKAEYYDSSQRMFYAVFRARAAIAQPEQKPVATQLLNRLEHQWHRMGELWERCQGNGWPSAESDEFTALRDEKTPANRAALLAIYASPPQRQPLTPERVKGMLAEAGYDKASQQERADFINGIRHAEIEHGIGNKT